MLKVMLVKTLVNFLCIVRPFDIHLAKRYVVCAQLVLIEKIITIKIASNYGDIMDDLFKP